MKIFSIVCNVALVAFTCFVLLTEGMSREAVYLAFTLLLLLIPVLSVLVISRSGAGGRRIGLPVKPEAAGERKVANDKSSTGPVANLLVIFGNIVLLGFTCWAIVDQYPHSEEDGVLAYTLVALLTPILNVAVLFRAGIRAGWPGLLLRKKMSE